MLLSVIALVLIAGCGSGGDSSDSTSADSGSSLTKAQLIKQGDAICEEGNEEVESEADEFAEENGIDTENPSKSDQEEVVAEADYYLQAADLEYQTPTPQDRVYAGILPVSPDGAVHQVTWSIGGSGATTRASRNNEWNPAVPTYREQVAVARAGLAAQVAPRLLSRTRRDEKGQGR